MDRKSALELVQMLNREDREVAGAVSRAIPEIARAVDAVSEAISGGGRLIYVGAGTSGRLGALDAAECPPTFGISSRTVRALIAGGRRALEHAVEGAEDSAEQGARDVRALGLGAKDVMAGLTASGMTPYVGGALREARRLGATTVLVATNPRPELGRFADIVIVADVGPEALAGSTRLKSGTAQKMVLNMLTTASMARLGRVYDNRMIYVALTNRKLRTRGLHMLAELADAGKMEARSALARAGGKLATALVMLRARVGREEAERRLAASSGHVRRAIELPATGRDVPAGQCQGIGTARRARRRG